jgi:AcrR family transcriptional regulator
MSALLLGGYPRKANSRRRLLVAAITQFCENGYFATSVEDIAAGANLSRMTFYRHFKDKADVAVELFRVAAEVATPRFLAVAMIDYRDREAVHDWIGHLFAADQANRLLLRVFLQATSAQDGFTDRAQEFIATLISQLGESLPAFALTREVPADRRRWLEAWLLLYEILDQSNHAALASGVAADPMVIEILTDRFLGFVTAS